MALKVKTLYMDQGATFKVPMDYVDTEGEPIPMSGFTASFRVKRRFSDAEPILALTSADGVFDINATTGAILLTVDAEATAALPAKRYKYDIELTDPDTDEVVRLMEGRLIVRPQV